MNLIENSTEYFEQAPNYVIDYLRSRGVNDEAFNKFISTYKFGLLEGVRFMADEEPFEITYILGKSKIAGYDIVSANKNLGTAMGEDIAIALVLGDDVICYNIKEENVSLCFIQTGEGEKIEIDKNLADFIKRFV